METDTLNLILSNANNDAEWDIQAPPGVSARALIRIITSRPDLGIPELDEKGKPIAYELTWEEGNRVIRSEETLRLAGVREGHSLVISAVTPKTSRPSRPRKRHSIFIGHGHSHEWKDLRHFLLSRLNLECDEFNQASAAGLTTVTRLRQMLDRASFAFLVMTAEDVHGDGTGHARENVIHEIGLFQGRLGFERAIVLKEEGCAEFSNILGLTHISFPKGNIDAAFEDIRLVLERERFVYGRR